MAKVPRSTRMRQQRLTASKNPLLVPGGRARSISRIGGGYTGAMSNWTPRRINFHEEGRQREMLADRANDLVANDPHACSLIDAINVKSRERGQACRWLFGL